MQCNGTNFFGEENEWPILQNFLLENNLHLSLIYTCQQPILWYNFNYSVIEQRVLYTDAWKQLSQAATDVLLKKMNNI